MVGEDVEWADGTLKVTGVVRGGRLSANRLVHLPDFGDHKVTKVRLCTPLIIMHRLMSRSADHVRSHDAIKALQGRCDGDRASGSFGTGTLYG